MEKIVSIPYEDYAKLVKDSSDKENVIALINTEFPDDTCQLIAIKAVLGIEEKDDAAGTDPVDPTDP